MRRGFGLSSLFERGETMLSEYESATADLCEFLGRKDFRVMFDHKTSQYEVQQLIPGGGGQFYWSTVLTTPVWHAGIKKEVHWGLTVSAEVITEEITKAETANEKDQDRKDDDADREFNFWRWQATPHRRIYSTG